MWYYGEESSFEFWPREDAGRSVTPQLYSYQVSWDLCAIKGKNLPKPCQVWIWRFYATSLKYFLNFSLAVGLAVSSLHRQMHPSTRLETMILKLIVSSMIMSDHIFHRQLKKYFQCLFSFRFILETAPYNISWNCEHCHRADPEGTDGSL